MMLSVADVVGLCGVLINGVVVIFLVIQLRLLRDQVNQAKDAFVSEQARARKQSTLEFMANTVARRHELAGLIPPEEEREEVQELLNTFPKDSRVRRNLYDYLNYYEMLATGVNTNVLDIGVVNRNSGGTIIRIYRTYAQLIRAVRRELNRPTMYEELETLVLELGRLRGSKVGAESAAIQGSSSDPSPSHDGEFGIPGHAGGQRPVGAGGNISPHARGDEDCTEKGSEPS